MALAHPRNRFLLFLFLDIKVEPSYDEESNFRAQLLSRMVKLAASESFV
jgi:hypothetical protein